MVFTFRACIAGTLLLIISQLSAEEREKDRRRDLMGPVHGKSAVTYIVKSKTGKVNVDGTVDVARTIGSYRRLNYSESEKIRALAQREFDGFVVKEIENLRPVYEEHKKKIEDLTKRKIAEDPSAATEIREEEQAALKRLDEQIRSAAVIAVKRRYGSQIAVPLNTPDHKPAVAITSFNGDQVEAPNVALKLDKEPGSSIDHDGEATSVFGGEVPVE